MPGVKTSTAAFLLVLAAVPVVRAADADPCAGAAAEIKSLRDADQADRSSGHKSPEDWVGISARDRVRRERVGRLAADGCLHTPADYLAAALVYQHGDAPDDYLQTYRWSMKAVELGDRKGLELAALGLDRYLMNTGRKQVYASQARSMPETPDCSCLWPVEETSTDDDRRGHFRPTLAEALKWVGELNKDKPSCGPPAFCPVRAAPTPRGSIPGVDW